MKNPNDTVLLWYCVTLFVVLLFYEEKSGKSGSLGRKNFFSGQGEKIIEKILNFFVKTFGGMKNIY